MEAFTHFLLGKADLDDAEKLELALQQHNHKLTELLRERARKGADEEMSEDERRKRLQKIQKQLEKTGGISLMANNKRWQGKDPRLEPPYAKS